MRRFGTLIALLCTGAFAQRPFFFLQLSDPQLGMYAKDADSMQEQTNLDFAIATANRLSPAFVVICGDLVNKAGDASEIADYRRLTAKLDRRIELYNVPGNHDVGNEPTPETLARYRTLIGRDYYTFDAPGFRGIVLNSSLIAAPGRAEREAASQERWLRGELEKARSERVRDIVVFQHHPYFLQSPDEPDGYFNIPRAARSRYLALLHEFGVKHVFAGHYHRNSYARDGELEIVATGPVGMPLGPDQSGLRVVIVEDSGMRHRYFELGSVPHQIDPAQPLP